MILLLVLIMMLHMSGAGFLANQLYIFAMLPFMGDLAISGVTAGREYASTATVEEIHDEREENFI